MNPNSTENEQESEQQAQEEGDSLLAAIDNCPAGAEIERRLAALTGAEHFLVGLAPHYWAFVPMCIADVHHLGLVNGVDCMVVHGAENNSNNNKATTKFIPVSKCTLTGIVVHVDRKSNGSILYLLDDGTGLMDCLQWNISDYYKLPPLVDDPLGEDGDSPFKIGDLIWVMGRLRVVSIQGIREKYRDASGREWEIVNCVREVRVTTIGHAAVQDNPRFFCFNAESQHWNKSVAWKEERTQERGASITNGVDTLRLLGPKISQQALEKSDFPAADDDVGAWRVFGTSCRCELSYKQVLLYCHCQATSEAMDPFLTFRDALLNKLIQMEQKQLSNSEPLHFPYQSVVEDTELQKVAQTIGESSSIPLQRVFLKTFAALRKDGVLHLGDEKADIYTLISRSRVIEPHLLKKMMRGQKSQLDYKLLQLERNSVLKDVPNTRIQHVKRCLEKNRPKNTSRPSRNARPNASTTISEGLSK